MRAATQRLSILAVVLIAACARAPSSPPSPPPAATCDAGSASASEALRLIDPGSAPRILLRRPVASGTVRVVAEDSFESSHEMATQPSSTRTGLRFRLALTVSDGQQLGNDGILPVRARVESVESLDTTATSSDSTGATLDLGRLPDGRLLPTAPPHDGRGLVDYTTPAFGLLSALGMVVPGEAVGVGARWEIKTMMDARSRLQTFTLESWDGVHARIAVAWSPVEDTRTIASVTAGGETMPATRMKSTTSTSAVVVWTPGALVADTRIEETSVMTMSFDRPVPVTPPTTTMRHVTTVAAAP